MSLNDVAWEEIFQHRHLLEQIEKNGFVYVTPDELKESGDKREPRLLAKHDTIDERPSIFKKHHLFMLPVRNNKYIIFKDDNLKAFYNFSKVYENIVTEEYRPARNLSQYQSINLIDISSESQAIDYAYLISLIKSFTNENELFLTIRGRLRSGKFSFNIPPNNQQIDVFGVQIEVDAGFESPEKIYIIEAKIGRVDNFNIRQLFYPYQNWSLKTINKDIIPIFFIYTNGLFYLIQLEFGKEFGDLRIVKSKCYTINEPKKQQVDYETLIKSVVIGHEILPYPQANDIDKIIDLVSNFNMGLTNKNTIAEFFKFDERQGDYYANAAKYLGLLRKESITKFDITREGLYLLNKKDRNSRNYFLLKQMLTKPSFNEIICTSLTNNGNIKNIDKKWVADVIQKYVTLDRVTAERRASTVISWIKWIDDNIEFIPPSIR